jgi:hypothetical protein
MALVNRTRSGRTQALKLARMNSDYIDSLQESAL